MKAILLSILLILSASPLIGKETSTEAIFQKLEIAFRKGDYKGGRKLLLQNRGNIVKDGGTDGYQNARAYCYEARFMASLDKFTDYQVNIDAANRILDKSPNENSIELFTNALLNLVEAYLTFDESAKAEKVINRLQKLQNEGKISNEFLKTKIDYLTVRMLIKQGYINQANKLCSSTITNSYLILLKPDKISKDEILIRKAIYGELQLLLGISLYQNGDRDFSDKQFQNTIDWANRNAPGDGCIAMAYYYQGQLKLDANDLLAANDLFQKAEDAAKKSYKPGAENYILIQEALIPTLKKLEKHKEAQIHNNAMDAAINDYYGRNGYHFYRNKISDIRRDIINENFERAFRDLNQIAHQNSEIPKNHIFRAELCELLYRLYISQNQYDLAYNNLVEFIRILKEKCGENAPNYHQALLNLAEYDYLYLDNFKEAESIFANSLDGIIKKEKSRKAKNMFTLVYMEITLYEITDRYDKAYALMKETHTETEKMFGNSSLAFASSEVRYAHLDLRSGNYKDAERKIAHAESIFNSTKNGTSSTGFVELLEQKAELLLLLGQWNEADETLNKSIKLYKKNTEEAELKTSSNMEAKAQIDMYFGRYNSVESEIQELISGREKKFGNKSRSLIKPLQLLSSLKRITGEFLESEKSINRALKISKDVFGEKSINYAENLSLLAQLNASVGDYEKAETNSKQVYQLHKTLLGASHIKTALAESDYALMKFYFDNQNVESKNLFTESLGIAQKLLGNDNPLVAEILENYSLLLLQINEYTKAEEYVNTAIKIWENRIGSTNIHTAKLLRLKGKIAFQQKKFQQAREHYNVSKNMFASLFDDQHEEYVQSLGLMARAQFAQGDIKGAISSSEENVDKTLKYLNKVFPALSERGKALFWDKVKEDLEFYKSLTFSTNNPSNNMIEKVYAISLQTKAILLNSSIKVRQKILSSGDTTLISIYNSWIKKREALTSALAQTSSQRKESNIDVIKLENEIENLEKKLSQSSLFEQEEKNAFYSWSDVKGKLYDKELAIEIIRFRKYFQGFTDTIWYAALSVSPSTKGAPEFALLKNGKELEGKYLKYYRNCIKGATEDEYSFEKYWKPLSALISKSTETIYFSMDGVYNQLNLETIKLPDGKYILNTYNLVLISSSKDLMFRTDKSTVKKGKANRGDFNFFGNPIYHYSNSIAVSQLDGAEEEVTQINKLVAAQKFSTKLYIRENATEESIKKLNNPYVFHIATHGFFTQVKNSSDDVQDPLLRSGLLLKSGGDIITTARGYELNRSEGVLTAREAMNLNLDSTSLVVLSACETGAGDITTGEGVFGLQRSFLVAGADNVIMSLFKVNDEATKDLMNSFYEIWLATGDKRKAFLEAKKQIQIKYKDPKYWGSFLIIGL